MKKTLLILTAFLIAMQPMRAQEAVDLGLSVKWSSCNVGADDSTEEGFFFSWGETKPKESYDDSNYRWSQGKRVTKYCVHGRDGDVDNRYILEAEDDAATCYFGSGWRMPTRREWLELIENCEWKREPVTTPTGEKVWGYRFISKINKNSIFLPAKGIRFEDKNDYLEEGFYWSSTLFENSGDLACSTHFSESGVSMGALMRYFGCLIRPVYGETILPESITIVPVEKLTLDPNRAEIKYGNVITLKLTIAPENPTDKRVFWSSSNTSVAVVAQDGRVTGLREGSAVITVESGGKTAACRLTVIDRREAVDMGVSVKWSPYNIGAQSSTDTGNFFAWGELGPKASYTRENYKFRDNNKYYKPGYIHTLEKADDAANNAWGGKWRIPTPWEWSELLDNCDKSWTVVNGVRGLMLTSKTTGNKLFFPASGYMSGTQRLMDGERGCYWLSTTRGWSPYEPNAVCVYSGGTGDLGDHGFHVGFLIRPVRDE